MPVYHFITGGAGTGKSVLIKAVYQSLNRFFTSNSVAAQPEEITVLLMAPTGKAAFNIGGTTIHSALGITTNENTSTETHMRDQTKNTYLSKLIIIIITLLE